MKPASETLGWPQSFVFYTGPDLAARQLIISTVLHYLQGSLVALNRAIRFYQIETPIMTPPAALAGHASANFELVASSFPHHGENMYLRPETTYGTYQAFRAIWPQESERRKAMPVVIWQYGKSFRDEQARPFSEMRFREFYQLEFQLFYAANTKADYFVRCVEATRTAVDALGCTVTVVPVTDAELAHYAVKTSDIFVDGKWEVAAVSERVDFRECRVIEVSVGLDRLTELQKVLK